MSALALSTAQVDVADQAGDHLAAPAAPLLAVFPLILAKRTAFIITRSLCKSGNYSLESEEDVRQEMLIAAWCRWQHFDPDIASPSTFLSVVMRNRFVSLVRSASALKRRPSIAGVAHKTHFSRSYLAWADPRPKCVDHCRDVHSFIERLPVDLRSTCELLMQMNVAETARELGIPRHRVTGQIVEIRRAFEEAGWTKSTKSIA